MPDLVIDAIAAGGAGVGRLDGLAVFVPRTAPGDTVEVRLRHHRRHAEGRLRRVVTAGPGRVAPACPHYERDRCGGCQLQHLDYGAQLEAKRDIVRQALRRIARRDVEVPPVHPSPSPWRYRNKLTLAMRRDAGAWRAGLRPYDAPDAVFALDDCLITSERVVAAWREVMAAAALLPEAAELRGAVREAGVGCALLLEGGDRWPERAAFAARCPGLEAIAWVDAGGRRHAVRESADPSVAVGAFAQVNAAIAPALHAHVAALVARVAPRKVIDAYGGSGAHATGFVAPGREVVLVELDAEATRLAGVRLEGQARVVTARVEDQLPLELPADAVVLNPPRAGVDARVCEALERAAERPRTIVYVSCDPATLARDLGRLPSWRIASLALFDMFPQTAHVETVCALEPEAA